MTEHEIRTPSKGSGVPREQRGGTFVVALCEALMPLVPAAAVEAEVEHQGFYDAALLAQWTILAGIVLRLVPLDQALPAIEGSPDGRVRGLAPEMVWQALGRDPEACIPHLRRQAAIPGTNVQEIAQMVLKRLFIEHGLEPVLSQVRDWIEDPIPEVRRCLVEALRPRGVWTGYIAELRRDPSPLRPLLERVLDDPSLYVRKAVANCLNDVSKDNPAAALAWVEDWSTGEVGPERRWILRQGLRSLIKAGDPAAGRLLGLAAADQLLGRWTSPLPAAVPLNAFIPIQVAVTNTGADEAQVLVQALLAGPGRGRALRTRRYRVGAATVAPGATVAIAGRIHFVDFNHQPRLPGAYALTVSVNGSDVETRTFRFER